ncbi:cytochrome P450 [Saccharopolyspora hirsuta]|uniref:cytochrome P450 n=1 Tax=Saccharopolyspora hirsuta TaxID=1837 RepID=UPI00332FDBB8
MNGEIPDLADPRTFAEHDLGDFWRRLRAEEPLHWQPPRGDRSGFWVLSRHADIMAVYRDDEQFSSERGNVLVTLLAGGDSAAGRMLAVTDGPRHQKLRKVLLKAFSPRALSRISERVRENTRRLVSAAVEGGECDFAAEIASRIPMATISDLLGVPESDRDFLLQQTKSALSSDDADGTDLDSVLARNEILLYFGEQCEQRRRNPGDDVISVLATSSIDGEPLSEDDVVLNCYSLIIGGDETSRLTMIDAVRTFADREDQWRRVKDHQVDLDPVVDEVLRWASPTMHFGRRAVRDVELHGRTIRAGDVVTLWHSSANRDERVFAEPEVFDVARSPNKHLAFGYGPHYCLGAYLAKVEVAEVLSALRDFATGFELAGPVQRIHSNFLTGISSLPVRFAPDAAGLERHRAARSAGVDG